MIDRSLQDEWGGIDKKMKSSVLGLNQHGIETTGSCEGNAAPCPWIMLKSVHSNIRDKANQLLDRFYSNRKVSDEIRIKIFPVDSRFYIYSGKRETFSAWRRSVNETAEIIARGEIPKSRKDQVSPSEYQNEFQEFGEFLLSNESRAL